MLFCRHMDIFLQPLFFLLFWSISFWLLSVYYKNVSVADIGWGLGFTGLAAISYLTGTFQAPILPGLAIIWGVRLSCHLFLRSNLYHEDPRYSEIRWQYSQHHFWWQSFFIIFIPQAILVYIIATPILLSQMLKPATSSTLRFYLLIIALLIWIVGMAIEIIGDWQLTTFKKKHPHQLCQYGLWGYSRHPNYFGELIIWWSKYVVLCLSVQPSLTVLIAIISPVLLQTLIFYVSGIERMEKNMQKKYPTFALYQKTTSCIIPWPKETSKNKQKTL